MRWRGEESFTVEEALNNVRGPLIEAAGPTYGGFAFIDSSKLRKRMYVSDLVPDRNVDFAADATKMPFADNSVGSLFISCMPIDKRVQSLQEAERIIEDDGYLVWQGGYPTDVRKALDLNFVPKQASLREGYYLDIEDILAGAKEGIIWPSIIFQKKSNS